jgi:hypothetical protein
MTNSYVPPRAAKLIQRQKQLAPTVKSPPAPLNPVTAPLAAGTASGLDDVVATFRKWLDLPDPGALEVMIAAYAANRLSGDPVWVLLVGPSSGGKGEVINPFECLPFAHQAAHVSEASLLSGTSKDSRSEDATGGLLKEVGEFGIFVMKDFTSMFTMNRDERGKALSALRHCYDGSWVRPVGSDGARKLKWRGKLGVLGGVTKAIDSEHEVVAKLGERFLFFRLPRISKVEALRQAHKAATTRGNEAAMRMELSKAVRQFIETLNFGAVTPELPAADRDWLGELVTLATRCRSYVARNSYNREIEDPGDSEGPGRMMRALTQLWSGLELIGVKHERRRELIQKVALDSMPPARRVTFDYLASTGSTDAEVAEISKTSHYSKQSIRRALQDLECHEVVVRTSGKPELWSIADEWRDFCADLKIEPKPIVSIGGGGGWDGTLADDD